MLDIYFNKENLIIYTSVLTCMQICAQTNNICSQNNCDTVELKYKICKRNINMNNKWSNNCIIVIAVYGNVQCNICNDFLICFLLFILFYLFLFCFILFYLFFLNLFFNTFLCI